jgi:Ca2+-binding RTX toxin-like protein
LVSTGPALYDDSIENLLGSPFDDRLTGSIGNNTLNGGAGNDTLNGGAGDDTLNGGTGSDTASYSGATSGVTVSLAVTTAQAVGGGQGSDTLVSIENLTGSSHSDTLTGNIGSNVISGGSGNDTISSGGGGTDTLSGGSGNDTFNFAGDLRSTDKIDGGSGTDTVNLDGNYASGLTFAATTMVNVEKLVLAAGYSYKLTTNNATVAAGKTLTINGAALSASNVLTFNGAAETNGHFVIIGGLGADKLTGGALSDTFTYTSAAQSTSTHYDTITGFNFSSDKFDIPGGVGVITGINAKVTSGSLSTASFDTDLASAMSGHLGSHHAVLFKPNAGTLSGQTFLVVDLNGVAGYQSGHDLVIRLIGSSGTLAAGGFH